MVVEEKVLKQIKQRARVFQRTINNQASQPSFSTKLLNQASQTQTQTCMCNAFVHAYIALRCASGGLRGATHIDARKLLKSVKTNLKQNQCQLKYFPSQSTLVSEQKATNITKIASPGARAFRSLRKDKSVVKIEFMINLEFIFNWVQMKCRFKSSRPTIGAT